MSASLVFGLSPVRKAMANKLAELSIGYPDSPLTRPGRTARGPAPGERAPVTDTGHPVGAGSTPRFALFAQADAGRRGANCPHRDVLEPDVRAPFDDDGIWLVRPDGYVAAVAGRGRWGDIDGYLQNLGWRKNGSRFSQDARASGWSALLGIPSHRVAVAVCGIFTCPSPGPSRAKSGGLALLRRPRHFFHRYSLLCPYKMLTRRIFGTGRPRSMR